MDRPAGDRRARALVVLVVALLAGGALLSGLQDGPSRSQGTGAGPVTGQADAEMLPGAGERARLVAAAQWARTGLKDAYAQAGVTAAGTPGDVAVSGGCAVDAGAADVFASACLLTADVTVLPLGKLSASQQDGLAEALATALPASGWTAGVPAGQEGLGPCPAGQQPWQSGPVRMCLSLSAGAATAHLAVAAPAG